MQNVPEILELKINWNSYNVGKRFLAGLQRYMLSKAFSEVFSPIPRVYPLTRNYDFDFKRFLLTFYMNSN